MVEPIGHTGGIIDPPPEYLPILREICDRHNILLIFDEIITGIGPDRAAVRRRDVRRRARRALHGQGAVRRLRSAVGDDLHAADRRRLLGPDRREPRLRGGTHLRGQPDVVRGRHRRAARDPRPRPVRQRPHAGRPAARGLRAAGARSTASSATFAARGCSRESSSSRTCATKEPFPAGGRLRRHASAGGRWRMACCAASTRTGSRSARRWW